jgi:hypothetical protein
MRNSGILEKQEEKKRRISAREKIKTRKKKLAFCEGGLSLARCVALRKGRMAS